MNPSPNPDKPWQHPNQDQTPADTGSGGGLVEEVAGSAVEGVAHGCASGCFEGCGGCSLVVLVALFVTAQAAFAVFR